MARRSKIIPEKSLFCREWAKAVHDIAPPTFNELYSKLNVGR